MKYLVTGGAGFIGSHLTDFLIKNNCEVIVLDDLSSGKIENVNQKAKFVQGSILDQKLCASLIDEVDGCFHLAAIASVEIAKNEWFYTNQVNLAGSVNIFELAAKKNIKVVYASSAAIYGNNDNLPLSEGDTPLFASNYGLDKYTNELHARLGASLHNLQSVGLRFFNVYGKRQDPASPYSGVISIFASKIAKSEPIKIYGDGTQSRDFIYIDDVVKFLNTAMESKISSDVFNVCTGNATTIIEVASLIANILGQNLEIEFADPRMGDIKHSIGNPNKAYQSLEIKAETSLALGLGLLLG